MTRECAADNCHVDLSGEHANKKYCSKRCMRLKYLPMCADCGVKLGDEKSVRCVKCFGVVNSKANQAKREEINSLIVNLREEGLLNYEIPPVLRRSGLRVSTVAVASRVYRMRKQGVSVPRTAYNHRVWMDRFNKLRFSKAR